MADFSYSLGLTPRQRDDVLPLFRRIYHVCFNGPVLVGRQFSVHDPDSCTDRRGPCVWGEAVALREVIRQLEAGPVVSVRLAGLGRGERVTLAELFKRVAALAAAEFGAGVVADALDGLFREFSRLIPSDPAVRNEATWRLAAERARVRGTGFEQREKARSDAYLKSLERRDGGRTWVELEEAAG